MFANILLVIILKVAETTKIEQVKRSIFSVLFLI
jgi:hypothetical protein